MLLLYGKNQGIMGQTKKKKKKNEAGSELGGSKEVFCKSLKEGKRSPHAVGQAIHRHM